MTRPNADAASVHALLRTRTAAAHAAVDAAFSHFDLTNRQSYAAFLLAHGRALSAIEPQLRSEPSLPAWQSRLSLLACDLDALGLSLPTPMELTGVSGPAENLGLLYVIEGSRLGGRVLMNRVHPDFSRRYLSAVHGEGEWRVFTRELDSRGSVADQDWVDRVVAGASLGFQLYAGSAVLPART